MQNSAGPRPGGQQEPPTIDITPDGYRVYRQAGGQDGRPRRQRSALGGIVSLVVVGLILLGAFALGVVTFLIALPIAVGALVAAIIGGLVLRHRLRKAAANAGSGPGSGPPQ